MFSDELLEFCSNHHIIPIQQDNKHLDIAYEQHPDEPTLQLLRFISQKELVLHQWPKEKIEQALQQLPNLLERFEQNREDIPSSTQENHVNAPPSTYQTQSRDDEPVIKLIHDILNLAIERRASDIHFEPYAKYYRVRLRIDGVLQDGVEPPYNLALRIAARLKIMSQLNIAERRLPQDGQLLFHHQQKSHAFRISSLPVAYGEKIVLRVMQSNKQQIDLNQLGLPTSLLETFKSCLDKPQGLILVTGPTGSGKTVSLYSGLRYINDGKRNICTIEDPIEIPIEGVNQTQINPKAGLSFSHILRAFLRQDPDVIMVGEIRDRETAEIAIEAAQTGHLVLSTLHTNSTSETLLRLLQMGIPSYLIASSLRLIVAQRLIRCLCPLCRYQNEDVFTFQKPLWQGSFQPWLAKGCDHCCSGYYGRTGLYEMLSVTPEIQQALLQQLPVESIHQLACEQGMTPLFQQGLNLAQQGITSMAELYRTLDNPMES